MLSEKKFLILQELSEGTGASIAIDIDQSGFRAGLQIWFGDLEKNHGPIAVLQPYGLKGHKVELFLGKFSREIINQMQRASAEDVQLARALISSIKKTIDLDFHGQNDSDWSISNGNFKITAVIRGLDKPFDDHSIIETCHEVIVPMMAAMAELIGYDVIVNEPEDDTQTFEGAIHPYIVNRRERNPRNRLLCIRVHGEKCKACGVEPNLKYGQAGSIIEVHHLEPISLLTSPRPYDPCRDLVPLCPNCHRAVHTRRPVPWEIEELKELMELCID
jgi:5-methylcytosine-specific restriction enzyme A